MNDASVDGHLAVTIGRILIALPFLWSGYDKITGFGPCAGMMRAHGIPLTTIALPAAIVLEIVCGLGLIANVFVPLAALVLVAFVIVSSIYIPVKDLAAAANPREKHALQIQLAGNTSIVGGLLLIAGASF